MIFPQLNILEQIDKEDQFGNQEIYYRVSINWYQFDKDIIEDTIKLYKRYYISGSRNPNQKLRDLLTNDENLLDTILRNQLSWDEFLKPSEFDYLYKKTDKFLIKKSYWSEINKYRKLALDQISDQPRFDTNVREKCLELSEKAIELYFYLITDAIYISGDVVDYQESVLLHQILLYRFWRHQTGIGTILSKIKIQQNTDLSKKLENNLRVTPIPGYMRPPIHSTSGDDYYYFIELLWNQIILNYIRDQKISSILEE